MRYKDSAITREQLDTFIDVYETHLRQLTHYSDHLAYLIARYSRGDDLQEIAGTFELVVDKVEATNALQRSRFGPDTLLFAHDYTYAGRFRDALVLVSLGLCLHAPAKSVGRVLAFCERGDPLLETMATAVAPSLAAQPGRPAFPQFFDGLYAALQALPDQRAQHVADYLAVWSEDRMVGFGFKIAHEQIGYWCIEAAGLVAALDVDYRGFADHRHFPLDIVTYYRDTYNLDALS